MLAVSLFSPRGGAPPRARLFAVAFARHDRGALLRTGDQRRAALAVDRRAYSLQPSEFAKPAFVVLSAWLFAESGGAPTCRPCRSPSGCAACFAGLLLVRSPTSARRCSSAWCGRRCSICPASRCCGAGIIAVCGAVGAAFAYLELRARPLPHRPLLRAVAGRQLPDRPRHAVVLRGRLSRPRPGRGHDQDGAARRAHRLHLRRRRRGVRRHRLPGAARACSPSSCCAPSLPRRGEATRRRGSPSRGWRCCSACRR